ncbi:MAG: hypothetical protein M3137_17400 [Actinomycetota bacterium]|nr:hypothetical protein [Actinomycetota bacterium]
MARSEKHEDTDKKPTNRRPPARRPPAARTGDRAKVGDKAAKEKKRRIRGSIGRLTMRSSFLRGRYVRRVLKSIDKAKVKGRRLPPELFELSQQLSRVPKNKQAEALEDAIKAGPDASEEAGRAMRRAASAQQRQSGRGQGRYRPGMPPPPPGQRRGRPR